MSATYARIGALGFSAAENLKDGKDYSQKQKDIYNKGIKLLFLLKQLRKHVDLSTSPPTLWGMTELQVHKILRCIEKIGELESFPVYPTLLNNIPPIILNKGLDGEDGEDGTDADIVVEANTGETEIVVTTVVIAGVKHYKLDFIPYTTPSLTLSLDAPTIYEKGRIIDKTLTLSSTKGSTPITALTLVDSILNALLQPQISLVTLNGVSQPVAYSVAVDDIADTTTYQGQVTDGVTPVNASTLIEFFYPYLFGPSDATSVIYSDLSKAIDRKQNRSFALNGTNKYFWIGYPASYGTLSAIRDQNGFNVTSEWQTSTFNITSVGLDVNWTISYRFYRTIDKTDINNHPYSIEF